MGVGVVQLPEALSQAAINALKGKILRFRFTVMKSEFCDISLSVGKIVVLMVTILFSGGSCLEHTMVMRYEI